MSHLVNDELPFEHSQEMAGLLSHHHPDLQRGSVVFFINFVRLGFALFNLIFGGMSALHDQAGSEAKQQLMMRFFQP